MRYLLTIFFCCGFFLGFGQITVRIQGDTLVCAGSDVTLTASGATNYTWSPATGLSSTSTAVVTATVDSKVTYTVVGIDGVDTATASITINVYTAPTSTNGSSVTITEGASVTLGINGGNTYSWQPTTDLSCTDCSAPVASPTVTTTYSVQITDSNGCIYNQSILVTVEKDCGDVFVPNFITPDDNGTNEELEIHGECIETFKLLIYNRWGEKVFESREFSNKWKGEYKGEKLNPDVFAYYLEAVLYSGETVVKKGNVSILKQ